MLTWRKFCCELKKEGEMRPKTLPNLITGIGLVLTALYAWAYLTGHDGLVFPAFTLAGSTDLLDGYLARRLNQLSAFGACLDPVRDRFLMLAALGNLLVMYRRDVLWFVITVSLLELAVLLLNVIRGLPQPIHVLGKARTGVHAAGALLLVCSSYVQPFLEDGRRDALLALMAFASVAALLGYVLSPAKPLTAR